MGTDAKRFNRTRRYEYERARQHGINCLVLLVMSALIGGIAWYLRTHPY